MPTVLLEFLILTALLVGASSVRRRWRERAHWSWLDLAAPSLGFLLWLALVTNHEPPKSLANAVIEPFILALAIGLLALARIVVGPHLPGPAKRMLFLVLSVTFALAIGALIGPLPE